MILPPATLGMLGGGQLGRFFVIAAHEMGYRVTVLDPDPHSPAGRIADTHLVAAYDDADALNRIAAECAAVSTEFENVPSAALAYLSKFIPVRPSAECVAIAQNRISEKSFLGDHGFSVGPFAVIRSASDIEHADPTLFPCVLKVSRFGYDGKGQARVANVAEAKAAFHHFRDEPCVMEKLLPLECEVSCVVARSGDGEVAAFPVAENRHRHGILDVSIVPARVSGGLRTEAEETAAGLAAELDYVGVMGVEFFVAHGRLLVNEIAPRPHNSGHYTLDACLANQFEQQVRTLCGLPLGEPRSRNAAVMVNLLGDLWRGAEPDWAALFAEPRLKLHLYGKNHPRPGRKMGHFTVIGSDAARTLEAALAARRRIGIDDSGCESARRNAIGVASIRARPGRFDSIPGVQNDIRKAVELLRQGELVAFPTETVYGLGADALNPQAVAKIFAAKGRPADHPLIVHLPLNASLAQWAREVPPAADRLAAAFWPGPLTLILKRQGRMPAIVTGGQDTVGLRVPDHALARELLAHFAGGIAAPSANRFGRISPTTAEHVRQELGDRVPLILDGGPCAVGIESTIVDLSRGSARVLRPGAIGAAALEEVLEEPLRTGAADDEDIPRAAGTLPAHYAPRTPLILVPAQRLAEEVAARVAQSLRIAVLGREVHPGSRAEHTVFWQRALVEPAGYAHDLYAHLRALDAAGVDLILVERPPEDEAWTAVNDRLIRAALGSGADEDT